MNLKEYVEATHETAIYPNTIPLNADEDLAGLLYCAVKLCGEAGEVSEQIGKCLRDDGGRMVPTRVLKIAHEMGDVFWYLARICHHLHLDPERVLDMNVEKLLSRRDSGKIQGDGSDR